MKRKIIIISLPIIFSLILAGCNLPGQPTQPPMEDLMNTAAAQTLQAQSTSIVQTNQAIISQPSITPTLGPTSGAFTATSEPADTRTATTQPSSEPAATATPKPTNTVYVTCDQASFVSETIPDGTDFKPGESFTKTWTLKNTGSCTWSADYDVVFVSGNAMGAPAAAQLTNAVVPPGATVKISLDLTAPTTTGSFKGDFKLRNKSGVLFGVGSENKSFWVKVDVVAPTETFYDFTKHYCEANVEWSTNAGILTCPGYATDEEGWVRSVDRPTLETGVTADKPGLQVHPDSVIDSWIKGIYPQITVPSNAYFTATIGCYATNNDCDVWFKLNYIVEGSTEKTLAKWQEVQDGKVNKVAVDLKDLAGKKVTFILRVEANGSYKQDKAMWYQPLIVK
jgi:hypothetical protein